MPHEVWTINVLNSINQLNFIYLANKQNAYDILD